MDEDRAYGAGRSSRTFTLGEAYSAAQDAAGLFLEYRDKFGEPETAARSAALGEVSQRLPACADADEALNPSSPDRPGLAGAAHSGSPRLGNRAARKRPAA